MMSGWYLERFEARKGDEVVAKLEVGPEQHKLAKALYPKENEDPLDKLIEDLLRVPEDKPGEVPTDVLQNRLFDLRMGMAVGTPKYAKEIASRWRDFVNANAQKGYNVSAVVGYEKDTL